MIKVLDKNRQLRAYLTPQDGVKDAFIDTRLNAECTLSFLLPLISEKWSELTPESFLITDNREFILLRPDAIDVERTQDGKVFGKVTAMESWKLLDKDFATVSNDPMKPDVSDLEVRIISGGPSAGGYPRGSAGSALTYLLQGTGWTLGVCDVEGTYDLETEKISVMENIQKVQELWGGYLAWDSINKKLSLRSEATWKPYSGYQVRYAKNLKHITRTDNNDIVTRLYVFGEDDLDISSVNDGIKYVEDYSYTDKLYIGVYQNQDIHDPKALKQKGQEIISKLCHPRYTYRVGLVDLRTLPEYSHETFQVGDMVEIIDPDIGTDQVRVVRHKYNVFQRWICELEIGEPEDRLVAQLAQTIDASKFVKDVLQPNPSTSNILKGFIDTFTTIINGAKGDYELIDGVSTWWERDSGGSRTGRIVRITPAGIGVSSNGGQTFDLAMTGDGVLANKVIVNELYALATDDGFTKLRHDGVRVFDEALSERVILGWWMDGIIKRFGLKIFASDGQTVLLDDRGILQTWQEGRADNVDNASPLTLSIYLPLETRSVRQAILRFRLQNFRAYEKAAASGGGADVTSASGGGDIVTSSSGGGATITSGGGGAVTKTTEVEGFTPGVAQETTLGAGGHNHGIPAGTTLAIAGGGFVVWSPIPDHSHALYRHHHVIELGNHAHVVNISSHQHNVSVPNHSHEVTVPAHTHDLNFGIYTSTSAQGVTIKINGVDRTTALGGPFNASQSHINIAPYLSVGQWNTIELGSSRLGRIDANVFIQAMMGV